jgi:type IV pilus assembly protein PilY1
MVDAWTGAELFDFSRPADGVAVGSDPRQYLDFPVAATVGMMMWGKQVRALNYDANGGYFDTATFGDTGSQLWVIRFNSPGHLTGGKADNWFGARAFQSAKTAGPTFCGQAPFFYITSNVILAANGMYRVAAGTGDRFNLLDTYGGTCGPDNIRACFDRGCTVTMLKEDTSTSPATLLNGVNVDTLLGKRQTGISAAACGAVTESSPQTATGNACNAIQGRVRLVISNCVLDDPSFTTTTKEYRVDCGPTATGGYGCAPPASFSPSTGDTILQKSAPSGMTSNSFASVRVWDDAGARMPFDSLAAAAAYDAARLQASDLTAIDGSSATPATTSVDSAGWLMKYNHDGNQTFNGQTYSLAKQDERTASPSAVIEGCAYWNTVQPTLTSSPCPCKAANTDRLSFFYGAKVGTGDLCLKSPTVSGSGPSCTVSASYARSLQGTTLTTPPAPQVTTFVSKTGQVATGLTSISVGQGALNVNVGTVRDATSPLEWLDVPREVHGFRHSPAAGPPPPNRW